MMSCFSFDVIIIGRFPKIPFFKSFRDSFGQIRFIDIILTCYHPHQGRPGLNLMERVHFKNIVQIRTVQSQGLWKSINLARNLMRNVFDENYTASKKRENDLIFTLFIPTKTNSLCS